MTLRLVLVGLLLLCLPLFGLDDAARKERQAAGKAAVEAYRNKDYKAYLENLLKVSEYYAANPGVQRQLAAAYALNGKTEDALVVLRRIVRMGAAVDLQHPDLASLADHPALDPIAAASTRHRLPLNKSAVAFTLAEKDLIPEGLAYDEKERAFYVGSLHKHKILRVNEAGKTGDLIPSRQGGIGEVVGMRVDSSRRILWFGASYRETPDGPKSSGIFKYDLRSGALLEKYLSETAPAKHLFNDLVPAKSGEVFFTDSEAGSVLRIRPGASQFEVLVPADTFVYPNGITLSSDERHLFVAHQRGVSRVDPSSGKHDLIAHDDTISLVGIDGLYWWKGSLVGIQNGFDPERIILVRLNQGLDTAKELVVLESGHPLFDIPTTGAIAHDRLYYIANSQLRNWGEQGEIQDPAKLKEPVILQVPLP